MFGAKKSESTQNNRSSNMSSGGSHSLNSLVQGTEVSGSIKAESDFRIDGKLTGDLSCASKVIIGTSGIVEGEVSCNNALIEGTFDGTLVVNDMLQIKDTATVTGDITYGQLEVEAGAVINGSCSMKSNSSKNQSSKQIVSESKKAS